MNQADFLVTEEMGLSLLDFLSGYESVILIDSACTGDKEPGELHLSTDADFEEISGPSNHYLGLPEIIRIARRLNIPFPVNFSVIGVEIQYSDLIAEGLSDDLKSKFPSIKQRVGEELQATLLV